MPGNDVCDSIDCAYGIRNGVWAMRWYEAEICRDTRQCCFRNRDTKACRILKEVYEKDGHCPFCKEKLSDKGKRAWEE